MAVDLLAERAETVKLIVYGIDGDRDLIRGDDQAFLVFGDTANLLHTGTVDPGQAREFLVAVLDAFQQFEHLDRKSVV